MLLAGKPTLELIDEVPWSALHHAYGSADDVPGQIRALLHPDPKVRRDVLFTFTRNIFHQGSRYPATVASIPFFVELLKYEGVDDRASILDLLAYLAVGYPDEHWKNVDLKDIVEAANPLREITRFEGSWMDPEYEIEEGTVLRECYAEVAAGFPVYFELLEHSDATIAIAASFLMAFFPLHAFGAGSKLLEISRSDKRHQLVRASALISLSYLQGGDVRNSFLHDSADALMSLDVTVNQQIPFLTACAALCLLRDDKWKGTEAEIHQLKQTAEACIANGIEEVECDFYTAHEAPDEIDTSEEYYEAFLAPQISFPWAIESHIKRHIRRLLRRNQS